MSIDVLPVRISSAINLPVAGPCMNPWPLCPVAELPDHHEIMAFGSSRTAKRKKARATTAISGAEACAGRSILCKFRPDF